MKNSPDCEPDAADGEGTSQSSADYPIPTNLGDGLIHRWGTAADCEALMAFNSRIHYFVSEHALTIPAMTRDLLLGQSSGSNPFDFSLIVEKNSDKIVSAMALIPQTWSYDRIPFKVTRPELVGTDPAYRGKGLIREQFRVAHALCRQRGQVVQAITGIPFFYRQFGYEMGLASGGGLTGSIPQAVPQADPSSLDHYNIIPIREADLGWVHDLYHQGCQRYLLTCRRDLDQLQYEVNGKSADNIHKVEIRVITTPNEAPVGFFICPKYFGPITEQTAFWFELLPGFDWQAVTPAVLRYLAAEGEKMAQLKGGACLQIGLMLGGSHPAYASAKQWLTTPAEPGVWYVRVADLPAFLCKIAPILNDRLAASEWNTFTGDLKISFYTQGVKLTMKGGKIEQIIPYPLESWEDADAAFPFLTFFQLLFGYRTLGELSYAYADCWCRQKFRGLVDTLFPKLPSAVWGIA